MLRVLTAAILCSILITAVAQDKRAIKYGKTITQKDLKERLSVLASDSLEGRETGEKGQKLAADYIASKFKEFGLEPPVETPLGKSYFQRFPLKKSSWKTPYIKKGEKKIMNLKGLLYFSQAETYGEEYVDAIMVDATLEPEEAVKNMDLKDKFVAFKSGGNGQKILELAKEKGSAGAISINENDKEFKSTLSRMGRFFRPRLSFEANNDGDKILVINKETASIIFDKKYDDITPGNTTSFILNADKLIKNVGSENVLGFLKGSEKPDEIVVITSHYDHIGITNGQINNGADDDGSGTTSVLEIAQAFSKAAKKGKGPKRSILFMTVSGEEKGLLGSRHYTDTDPVFPLENTVVNLNIDMVGRIDPDHEKNPNYVYVIGADKLSQELHEISENVNKTYTQIDLDYKYNDENDPNRFYYRSDHYNFAKNNVPVIFYFNGTHADYHKPTDTIEKINFEVMEKRVRLVFYTGWELANREERIKLTEPN